MASEPRKGWTWKGLAGVAGSAATAAAVLFGAVWAASADRSGLGETIREHEEQINDHEARLRAVEKDIHQTAADVRWIRQAMEKRQP